MEGVVRTPSEFSITLGWEPSIDFENGLEKTVDWYLQNEAWMEHVTSGEYQQYYDEQYGEK